MRIETDTSLPYMRYDIINVTYSGTRSQLIRAGIATESMFPMSEKRTERRSSKSNPTQLGEWVVWTTREERTDPCGIWKVLFRSPIEEIVDDEKVAKVIRAFLYSKR